MKHKTLTEKRTRKALARKNKQYAGPKYSKLDMMAQWAPLLERAGIIMFEPMEGVREQGTSKNNTSFV